MTDTQQLDRLATIEACKFELATNFDAPAESILGFYGARLGVSSDKMREILEEKKRHA
jgi:hypothetical protein